jgi:hypothetical protein
MKRVIVTGHDHRNQLAASRQILDLDVLLQDERTQFFILVRY